MDTVICSVFSFPFKLGLQIAKSSLKEALGVGLEGEEVRRSGVLILTFVTFVFQNSRTADERVLLIQCLFLNH